MLDFGLPNDRRGFIHKRLIGGVGGFLTGGPGGALGGFLSGGGGGGGGGRNLGLTDARRRAITAAMRAASARGDNKEASAFARELGSQGPLSALIGAPKDTCSFPQRWDPRTRSCAVFLGSQTGRDDAPVGEAVMGRYGAALVPGSMVIDRAVCLPGMHLGNDGLCYNKGVFSWRLKITFGKPGDASTSSAATDLQRNNSISVDEGGRRPATMPQLTDRARLLGLISPSAPYLPGYRRPPGGGSRL